MDDNRRFITTSDDKSLRAWEYNIPVPIKFIAEPYMYPLTRASAHPSGKSVAFQSGDNQIVVYASTDRYVLFEAFRCSFAYANFHRFRQNRKKSFRGHNSKSISEHSHPTRAMLTRESSRCRIRNRCQHLSGRTVRDEWGFWRYFSPSNPWKNATY